MATLSCTVCLRRPDPPALPDADAALMMRASQGDSEALNQLVTKYRRPIMRHAYRMVRNRAISEELAQDVFLKVHYYRASYQPTAKFSTWLYRIATRVALNWIRDHAPEGGHERIDSPFRGPRAARQYSDGRARIDEWLLLRHRLGEIREAVGELPERQQRAVQLQKFEEKSCEEIAFIMGCSEQAVRSLLNRAYATLRRRLAHFEAVTDIAEFRDTNLPIS